MTIYDVVWWVLSCIMKGGFCPLPYATCHVISCHCWLLKSCFFTCYSQPIWWQLEYFFDFHPENWGRFPFWLILFNWAETTNLDNYICLKWWKTRWITRLEKSHHPRESPKAMAFEICVPWITYRTVELPTVSDGLKPLRFEGQKTRKDGGKDEQVGWRRRCWSIDAWRMMRFRFFFEIFLLEGVSFFVLHLWGS